MAHVAGGEAAFRSILSRDEWQGRAASDDVLHDLALDQVFDRIGVDAPTASSAFRTPLADERDVRYRQDVFRGLDEQVSLRAAVDRFLVDMADCGRLDAEAARGDYRFQRELWHLDAVGAYARAVEAFDDALEGAVARLPKGSAGWRGLAEHVAAYRGSPAFASIRDGVRTVKEAIDGLRYNALIRGGRVTIAPVDDEPDLSRIVLETFDRFRQHDVADHHSEVADPRLDHVQAQMLALVGRVYPAQLEHLVRFAAESADYQEPVLARFTDEVRFYLAYLDYIAPMRAAGLDASYPVVSSTAKTLSVTAGWDLALAARLVGNGGTVVTNDLLLEGAERILVVSGPNQGGKTTTARMFGQLHHLAALGCPVPGRDVRIFLCDQVFTVFEREEQLETLEGRLGSEVQRLHDVFEAATGRSVIVVNEAFASTALQDARVLTRDVLERISRLDALAACVTFIDELSRLNEKTVSMVSLVDPDDPAVRTLKVERRRADGRAYARALAAKHGLTLDQIRERLGDREEARR